MRDPYLDKGMRGWIVNTARVNLWRMDGHIDLDDLIQEGYFCFCRIRKLRPHANQKQTMVLVKLKFNQRIIALAHKSHKVTIEPIEEAYDWSGAVDYQQGPLVTLLKNAPKEVLEAIAILAADTNELKKRIGRRLLRETTNARVARLLGVPEKDFTGMIAEYLRG